MSRAGVSSLIDLRRPQRVHVVGVGGAGMSAIAAVLAAMGHEVTGSDLRASSMFQRLQRLGLSLSVGHDASNVAGASVVTFSSAIDASNVELAEGRRLGIPVLSRADVLAAITSLRRTIAVAGTHGKTTTSSMLSLILVESGLRPSFIIGGDLNDIGTNAVWDTGEWLVVEADESDRTFLRLSPEVALVTSIEPDHLEIYGSFESLREAFRSFMAEAATTVVSADDETALELAPARAVTFGRSGLARYQLDGMQAGRSQISFLLADRAPGTPDAVSTARSAGSAGSADTADTADTARTPDEPSSPDAGGAPEAPGAGAIPLAPDAPGAIPLATEAPRHDPSSLGEFHVAVPGEHNARNAAAAVVVALTVGADVEAARRALARFAGVARRFEFRGERNGVTFVDDYAHLPSEVKAALAAARSGGYERVVCVFQPHRYSRIATLVSDFADVFADCDVLFVTDVYAAGEEARPGVTGRLVTDAVLAAHPAADVAYTATHEELLVQLRETLRPGDCCITLEAGDLTGLPDELLSDDRW